VLIDALVGGEPRLLQSLRGQAEGHHPGAEATQAKQVQPVAPLGLLQQLPRLWLNDVLQALARRQLAEL
jgi:hypothetical protein